MKTLGLLGGMSWESTAVYYRLLNQAVAQRLGGLHSANLLLHNVDFAPLAARMPQGDWAGIGNVLVAAAQGLKRAGAQGLLVATNTMHKMAARIESEGGLPLLHIAHGTGAALKAAGHSRVALLGTRYTMEDTSILAAPLGEGYGVQCLVPAEAGRALLQRVVFDELCRGVVKDESRAAVLAEVRRLQDQGAQAVVLGCTELMLLLDDACSPLPTFDTCALHVGAAVSWMLDE